jgi:hypothetical protein
LPPDNLKKSSEFSKTNWGDYTVIDGNPHGDLKVKRASVYLRTVRNLRPVQWQDIINVALSFHASGKQKNKQVKVEELNSETESEDDLVDPRYDEVPATEPDDME